MSKAQFFHHLRERLRGLPDEEQQSIIRVYEELFQKAESNGKSEREIIESLGFQPNDSFIPSLGRPSRNFAETGIRIGVAAIALGFFNIIFILGPFIAVSALLFALTLTAVLLACSSIWIVIGTGVPETLTTLLLEIFTALTFTGLGVLLGIGMWKADRLFLTLVKRYVRLNLKLIKGE